MKRPLSIFIGFFPLWSLAFAQERNHICADTFTILFPRSYSTLINDFGGNNEKLVHCLDILNPDNVKQENIKNILLIGNASPDGTEVANRKLTQRRIRNVESYLKENLNHSTYKYIYQPNGIDWIGIKSMVESDPNVPYRNEVIDILTNTPVLVYRNHEIVDGRNSRLGYLQKGIPYRYLMENIFPSLRNVQIIIEYQNRPDGNSAQSSLASGSENRSTYSDSTTDNSSNTDRIQDYPGDIYSNGISMMQSTSINPIMNISDVCCISPMNHYNPKYVMAIKTNLAYDVLLMPSLEMEFRLNRKWTLNLEGEVAWWSDKPIHRYYQIASIGPEVRYWFKEKDMWHGHYAGLFAHGGWYDLENRKMGYKGEYYTIGLSYGYMFPLTHRLSFEAGIGIGFLFSEFEEYLPIDKCYVYQRTKQAFYVGPVKLKLGLVWKLWKYKHQGGIR